MHGRVAFSLALAGASLTACVSGIPRCTTCAIDYTLAEYRSVAATYVPPRLEVTPTPTYEEARKAARFKMAAIRLPDTCLRREGGTNDSAAEASGVSRAKTTQTILSTDCGVWLAELERALTQSGFGVISWDALRQIEVTERISTYVAAKKLLADIVFIFNSLDVSPSNTGGTAGMKFRYFASNEKGQALEPRSFDDGNRAWFREAIKTRAGSALATGAVALASTLDSTAIDTGSGQAVWFFRRTVTQPLTSGGGMQFLFARTDATDPWAPTSPVLPKAPVRSPTFATEDAQDSSVGYSPDNQFAAEKLELIRAAAKDFVTKFQHGG